jgi:pectate lyase
VPLFRGGTAHFFNNYCEDVYGGIVNTRVNACIRVEKNYFENSKNTIYSKNSTIPGKAQIIDNKEVNCKNPTGHPAACTAAIPYNYSKSLTTKTADVKLIVKTYAGVGKLK